MAHPTAINNSKSRGPDSECEETESDTAGTITTSNSTSIAENRNADGGDSSEQEPGAESIQSSSSGQEVAPGRTDGIDKPGRGIAEATRGHSANRGSRSSLVNQNSSVTEVPDEEEAEALRYLRAYYDNNFHPFRYFEIID